MKKASEYLMKSKIGKLLYITKMSAQISNEKTDYDGVIELIEKIQKETYNQAIDDAIENVRTCDDPYVYTGNTGSEYPPDIVVDKESLLKLKIK
jgi:hypothetical protein